MKGEKCMVEHFEKLLTTSDLCAAFDRTPMTIYLWRKNEELPCVKFPSGGSRPAVRFNANDVRQWAKKCGKTIVDESVFATYENALAEAV